MPSIKIADKQRCRNLCFVRNKSMTKHRPARQSKIDDKKERNKPCDEGHEMVGQKFDPRYAR
jgi:hypothetical protein